MANSKKPNPGSRRRDKMGSGEDEKVSRASEPDQKASARRPGLPSELTIPNDAGPLPAVGLTPPAAWFLGPKAEHGETWERLLSYVFQDYIHWRRNYFPGDPVVVSRTELRRHEEWLDLLSGDLDLILNELKAHFPFYHPRYLAHMLSEQTLPAVLGYFAAMLYNPNNVTDEAAPVTVRLELEVGRMVSKMMGYKPESSWAHVTSGGTIANLEALWVARTVQYVPFALRDFCSERNLDFRVQLPNRTFAKLAEVDNARLLLGLRPNESIFMPRKLAKHLVDDCKWAPETAKDLVGAALADSQFNVSREGFHRVVRRVGLEPVVFASAATHYSMKKACNVLGYGERALCNVPVTSQFRIDLASLEDSIRALGDDSYVAAVIGIVGTTEEGAVDPIHELKFMRERLIDETNRSFWLHVDAAWGGYIASLFRGHSLARRKHGDLDQVAADYANAIDAREDVYVAVEQNSQVPGKKPKTVPRKTKLFWGDVEVYKAFLAIGDADSVTVDPHKLGYVPYPAGIVAFRNGVVTDLLTQEATYISAIVSGMKSIDEPVEIHDVGPYILEGSKPGAAAAACWLAHKTIPLDAKGHGQIMRATLLNAGRFARYLDFHRHLYAQFERALAERGAPAGAPFTFVRLFSPDTNIVCFVARPMALRSESLIEIDCSLEKINAINEEIHARLGRPSSESEEQTPYGHPYFVSRTVFRSRQYTAKSMGRVLTRVGVSASEYNQHGLFVLRSTVMNPHYHMAAQAKTGPASKDYLLDFVKHLHVVARRATYEQPT